jgi:hypothetical protein
MTSPIYIAKRIPFSQIVLSICTVFAFVWDSYNPEYKLPAGVVTALAQAITGVGQVLIVRKQNAIHSEATGNSPGRENE